MTLDGDRIAAALPGYDIGSELGRGAWGVVLQGRHRQLGRAVAIKELPEAFAADPGVRRRFVSEARLLAELDHPHIVPIYDYVEHDGLCLLVMELLGGGTLWRRFTSEGVAPEAACSIMLATSAALQHAHDGGILHRDVKPENLLFTENGTLKVSDFGIAKVVGGAQSMGTRTGEVLGTPAYMAPEQAMGEPLTPTTDVYAVGAVLYELLSGRLPFPDDGNPIAVLYRHVHEEPIPLLDIAPTVPPEIAAVTMLALVREPADRYATADDFGIALADAATAAWGPGWIRRSGVRVIATGRIGERISGGSGSLDRDAPTGPPLAEAPVIPSVGSVPIGSARRDATIIETPLPSPDELVPVAEILERDEERRSIATEPVTHLTPPLPSVAEPSPADGVPAPTAPRSARRRGGRRALVVVAAGVIAAVVAAVAVFALGGGGGSSPSAKSPGTRTSVNGSPKVTATVAIGAGASHVAADAAGVFVTDSTARTIVRVDPSTNTASPIATLTDAPHSIAIDGTTLWVTTNGAGGLARVAPGTAAGSAKTTPVPVGAQVNEVAAGVGGVWASAPQQEALVRVDPQTDRVVATIGVGGSPDSVVTGAGAVWVANRTAAGTVTRVDPATNRVVATIAVGGLPDQLAFGNGAVWVANSADSTVSRIDAATNTVTATIRVGAQPKGVVTGSGRVWVSNTADGTVSTINPATNSVTHTTPVGAGPEASAAGVGAVWIVDTAAGTVSRIRPS